MQRYIPIYVFFKILNVFWVHMSINIMKVNFLCVCEIGYNPLICIRRSQRRADADFGHRSQDSRGAEAAPFHSCGASTVGLKQTGSAYKDVAVTWILWTLSQVLRCALFINMSVSLHTAPGGWEIYYPSRRVQWNILTNNISSECYHCFVCFLPKKCGCEGLCCDVVWT